MSIKNWNAGIIRPVPVAPAGPFETGSAPGVWTLDQVAYWQKQGLWPIAGNLATGIFAGGFTATGSAAGINVVDYINIASAGNAGDWGDLSRNTLAAAGAGNSTRGLIAGGYADVNDGPSYNNIEYLTVSTKNTTTDFGDLTQARFQLGGGGNPIRSIFAQGNTTANCSACLTNVIDYVTIASAGNATDFGDAAVSNDGYPGTASSSTRMLMAGGFIIGGPGYQNIIQYITIASTGNSADFGDLTVKRTGSLNGVSDSNYRAVFGGGDSGVRSNVIDYVNIPTLGDATDFGDLTVARQDVGAVSNATRGVWAGGYVTGWTTTNVIDYVTMASTGNATDFGDLTVARNATAGVSSAIYSSSLPTSTNQTGTFSGGNDVNRIQWINIATTGNAINYGDLQQQVYVLAGVASTTRSISGGGERSGAKNNIQYITFTTGGTATDFGDLTVARYALASCNSSTRGIFAGGNTGGSYSNIIDYITMASAGNATDFGDIISAVSNIAGCSSPTRGLFAGGVNGGGANNVIQYITIASTGNSTDFGDLSAVCKQLAACSSSTRGLFAGGRDNTTQTNTINYVTIASTGDSTDFGDLTVARYDLSGLSSETRGVFGGGQIPGSVTYNVLDYVTIASEGNATDFGDLNPYTTASGDADCNGLGACSNCGGGVQ